MIWFVRRVVRAVFRPESMWEEVAGERGIVRPLIYLAVLVLVHALLQSAFLWLTKQPLDGFGTVSESVLAVLFAAPAALVGCFLVSFIVWTMTRSMGGADGLEQSVKLVSYSSTPYLVGVSFVTLYRLEAISLVFLGASLVLAWVGLRHTVNVPKKKQPLFMVGATLLSLLAFSIGLLVFAVTFI